MKKKIGEIIRKYLDVPEVQDNLRKLSAFKTLCKLYPERYRMIQDWAWYGNRKRTEMDLRIELWYEYKDGGKLRRERIETLRLRPIEDWEKESNAPF